MSEQVAAPKLHRLVDPPEGRIERGIAWFADHSSPILIKEIRQALKGRAFLVAYMLLLLAALLWSLWGMSITLNTGMQTGGGIMLVGYLWILGFPLAIVVPLTAYRSLCREFEEDTLHLVSITTMSPRQLVLGKLVSAMAQMLIYLSALAPCIAFTWMLRGVDVTGIVFALLLAMVGSAALSSLALFLGANSRNSVFRIVVMVGLFGLLTFVYIMWCVFRTAMEAGEFGSLDVSLQIHVGLLAGLGTTGYLLLESAAASISFPAENSSTRPRVAMILQTTVLTMVILGLVFHNSREFDNGLSATSRWQIISQIGMILACGVSLYWMVMGAAMCGESPRLSSRVQRSLPRSFMGRSFGSLLMPGPGRGYLLAVNWIVGATLVSLLGGLLGFDSWGDLFRSLGTGNTWIDGPDMGIPLVGMTYALFYLSVVYLFLLFLRRINVSVNPVVAVVIFLLFFAVINVASGIFHMLFCAVSGGAWDTSDFTVFLLPNIFMAFAFLEDNTLGTYSLAWMMFGMFVMGGTILLMLHSSRELLDKPAAIPTRVLEELAKARKVKVAESETFEEIFAGRIAGAGQGEGRTELRENG